VMVVPTGPRGHRPAAMLVSAEGVGTPAAWGTS
jgi:hypothetical protein